MAYTIDTAEAIERLMAAELRHEAARAIVDTVTAASGELATKDDVLNAKIELTAKIEKINDKVSGLEAKMTNESSGLETKIISALTMRAIGIAGLATTIIIGSFALLNRDMEGIARQIRDLEGTISRQIHEEVRALSLERRSSEPDD